MKPIGTIDRRSPIEMHGRPTSRIAAASAGSQQAGTVRATETGMTRAIMGKPTIAGNPMG
jgi:hypothetical protein